MALITNFIATNIIRKLINIINLAAAPPGLTSDTKTPFSPVARFSFINICTPSPRLSFRMWIFFTVFFCMTKGTCYKLIKKFNSTHSIKMTYSILIISACMTTHNTVRRIWMLIMVNIRPVS